MNGKSYFACWILTSSLAAGFGAAQVPPRSHAGQTLEAPEAELDLGLVYHSEPGRDAQIVVTSAAPLQKVVLTNGRVVGYIVAPFDLEEEEKPVLAGAFRIPVRMFKSGLESVDGALHGGQLLDADTHPEITFRIQEVSDVELREATSRSRSYDLTLRGELVVKTTKIPLQLKSEILFIPFVMQNLARNVGDLAILKTSLVLKPADFGWQPPRQFQGVVADELTVDVHLILNTVSPDMSGDPREDPALFARQTRFVTLLRDLQDASAAYDHARKLIEEIWTDEEQLERLARAIVETPAAQRRDYALALKSARRCNELRENSDPSLLALIARIHHERGDHAEAVQWQEKALESLGDSSRPREAQAIKEDLERYRKEKSTP